MSAVLKSLEAECAKMGGLEALCDKIAVKVVDLIEKLPETLYHGGLYTPKMFCSLLDQCTVPCCKDNTPTQIHLSVGGGESGVGVNGSTVMTVTWVTKDESAETNVRYGTDGSLNATIQATTRTYTAGGWVGAIHSARMDGLVPGARYMYMVGGASSGWSAVNSFQAPRPTLDQPYSMIFVGDMGEELEYSAANQEWLNYGVAGKPGSFPIDAVVHVGDISYADGYMGRWDEMFSRLQPTASAVPYMTCPGNHEFLFNFTSYQFRFGHSMPNVASGAQSDAMYYSWDVGCTHFISLNTESIIDTPYMDQRQIEWLEMDLKKFAERREAGKKWRQIMNDALYDDADGHASSSSASSSSCSYFAPSFLVVYMHRPMYCSNSGGHGKRCTQDGVYFRSLIEPLLVQFDVDLVVCGHNHNYERSTPVVEAQPNDKGPIYIVNGAGGNREGAETGFISPSPPYSAFRAGEFGLGSLTIVNSSVLHWKWYQQTDLDQAMKQGTQPTPLDEITIQARQ